VTKLNEQLREATEDLIEKLRNVTSKQDDMLEQQAAMDEQLRVVGDDVQGVHHNVQLLQDQVGGLRVYILVAELQVQVQVCAGGEGICREDCVFFNSVLGAGEFELPCSCQVYSVLIDCVICDAQQRQFGFSLSSTLHKIKE
jgi:hypothetical protein